MAFKGADTQQLRDLAGKLRTQGETINSIISQLTSAVTNVDWKGPDATRFKADWNSTHVPALKRVAEELGRASTAATKNATEQDTASG